MDLCDKTSGRSSFVGLKKLVVSPWHGIFRSDRDDKASEWLKVSNSQSWNGLVKKCAKISNESRLKKEIKKFIQCIIDSKYLLMNYGFQLSSTDLVRTLNKWLQCRLISRHSRQSRCSWSWLLFHNELGQVKMIPTLDFSCIVTLFVLHHSLFIRSVFLWYDHY